MAERLAFARATESAFFVECDGGIVGRGDPQSDACGATRSRSRDHRFHQPSANTTLTRGGSDEHPDQHGARIVAVFRVTSEARCEPDSLAVLLCDERDPGRSGGALRSTFAPHPFGEGLFTRQRRAGL